MSEFELEELLSRESLAGVYRRFSRELIIYADSILRNTDDSQEVVQDLFCALQESLPDRKILTSTLRSYLYVSVRNRSFNLLKRSKRTAPLIGEQLCNDAQYERIDDKLTGDLILGYVRNTCSSEQIEIFTLRISHDLTWQEISDVTGMPLSSAYKEFDQIISVIKRKFPDVF